MKELILAPSLYAGSKSSAGLLGLP